MKRERFKLPLSVFVVLIRADHILLLRRAHTGWMDNMWSVPAGAIDGGEALNTAACREALEEVGVSINPKDLMLKHFIHCFTEGDEWSGLFFSTEKWTGEPRVMEPHKHDAVQWVHIDALPLETIPYVKQAIEAIKSGLRCSEFSM